MQVEKYWCPYCQAIYAFLPGKCAFCKKELPAQATREFAFVRSLSERLSQLTAASAALTKETGEWCAGYSERLQQRLATGAAGDEARQEPPDIAALPDSQSSPATPQFAQLREFCRQTLASGREMGIVANDLLALALLFQRHLSLLAQQPAAPVAVTQAPAANFTPATPSALPPTIPALPAALSPTIPVARQVSQPAPAMHKRAWLQALRQKSRDSLQHPALRDNLLLFLGVLLILVGEVWMVSHGWGRMSDQMRLAGIFALLFSPALLFYLVGLLFGRYRELAAITFVCHYLTLLLLPLSFTIPAQLLPGHVVLALAMLLPATALCALAGKALGKNLAGGMDRLLPRYFLPLCLSQLMSPLAAAYFPVGWTILVYAALAFVLSSWRPAPATAVSPSPTPLFAPLPSLLAWILLSATATLLLAAHASYQVAARQIPPPVFAYALLFTMMALALAWIDCRLHPFLRTTAKPARGFAPRAKTEEPAAAEPTPAVAGQQQKSLPWWIAGSCLVALSLSLASGHSGVLLAATVLGALFFALATWRLRDPYFLLPALLLALLGYLLLPVPFRTELKFLRLWLAGKLGYQNELPYCYYAITFLPYLIAVGCLASWLKEWKLTRLATTALGWLVAVASGLLLLTEAGGCDPYVFAIAFPLYAAGFFFAMRMLQAPILLYLVLACGALWIYEMAAWRAPQTALAEALLLACAAVCWLMSAWARRQAAAFAIILHDAFVALLCAATVSLWWHTLSGWPLALWLEKAPPLTFAACFLAAALLWLLALFTLHSRWLLLPAIAHLLLAATGIAARLDAQSETVFATCFLTTAYLLCAAYMAIRLLPRVGNFLLATVRPGRRPIYGLAELFLYPLRLIVLLFLVLGVLLLLPATFTEASPLSQLLWLSLAVFLLTLPQTMQISLSAPLLTELPVMLACVVVVDRSTLPLALSLWLGVSVYLALALYHRQPYALAMALAAWNLSLGYCLYNWHFGFENAMLLYLVAACLWHTLERLYWRRDPRQVRLVLEWYTSITVFMVMWFIARAIFLHFSDGQALVLLPSLLCALLVGAISLLRAANRSWPAWLVPAFLMWSGALTLIVDRLLPASIPALAFVFALWGLAWHGLPRVLAHKPLALLGENLLRHAHTGYYLQGCAVASLAFSYALAQQLLLATQPALFAYAVVLAIVAATLLSLARRADNPGWMYAALLVLNQIVVSCYLSPFAGADPYAWVWPQAWFAAACVVGLATLGRLPTWQRLAVACAHYASLSLGAVVVFLAAWRLSVALGAAPAGQQALRVLLTAVIGTAMLTLLHWLGTNARWQGRTAASPPVACLSQPYLLALSLLLVVTLAADAVGAAAHVYPLALAALAIFYSLATVWLPAQANALDRLSVGVALLALCVALFVMLPADSGGRWMAALTSLLAVHAGWLWLKCGRAELAYVACIYLLCTIVQEAALHHMLPWYTRFFVVTVAMAVMLGIALAVHARQTSLRLGHVVLCFHGRQLATAIADIVAGACTLGLLPLLLLWTMLPDNALEIWNWQRPFLASARDKAAALATTHAGWWLTALVCYVAIWAALAGRSRWRQLAIAGAILTVAQLLLWFPRLTCLAQGYSWSWPLLEWSLCAVALAALAYLLPARISPAWSASFAIAATLLIVNGHTLGAAVVSSLLLAFSLLLLDLAGRRRQPTASWYPLYVTALAVAMLMVMRYLLLTPTPSIPLSWLTAMWPALALILAVSRIAGGHRDLARETARFLVFSGLAAVIAVALWHTHLHGQLAQFFGHTPPAANALPSAVAPVVWGLAWSMAMCVWLALHDRHQTGLYVAHFIAIAMYLTLRWRAGMASSLAGYDSTAVFLLFAVLPQLAACFARGAYASAIGNASLLAGLATVAAAYFVDGDAAVATLLLAFLCLLVALREVKTATGRDTTTSGIATVAATAAAVLAYSAGCPLPSMWLCALAMLLAVRCLVAYLVAGQSASLFFACTFFVVAVYPGVAVGALASGAEYHPLWLLSLANILLLPCLTGDRRHQLTPRLALDGRQVQGMCGAFAAVLAAIVCTAGLAATLAMVFDFGRLVLPVQIDASHTYVFDLNLERQAVAKYFAHHGQLMAATIVLAVATAWHLARYLRLGRWLLAGALLAGGGILPVLSRLLQGVAWEMYAPPACEWALLGLGVWYFGHRHAKPEVAWRSLWCVLAALAVTRLEMASPLTSVILSMTAALLLVMAITRGSVALLRTHALALLAAFYFAAVWRWPLTAQPVLQSLPLAALSAHMVALLALAATLFADLHARGRTGVGDFAKLLLPAAQQIAAWLLLPALSLIAAAVVLVRPDTPGFGDHERVRHTMLCGISLVLALWQTVVLARRSGKQSFYLAAQAIAVALFYFLRLRTSTLDFVAAYEAHALVLIAFAFWQAAFACRDLSAARALRWVAMLLPLAVLAYQPWHLAQRGCTLLALAAAHFAFVHLHWRRWWSLGVCLAWLHMALFQFWWLQGLLAPQFYGVPVGLTMLALAEINRARLAAQVIAWLRWLGLVIVYGACGMPILLELHQPMYWLALGLISLAGILAGLWLGNALYTYVALVFFLADVFGYSLKYGAEHDILEGVLMVLAGTVLLGTAIVFNVRRRK